MDEDTRAPEPRRFRPWTASGVPHPGAGGPGDRHDADAASEPTPPRTIAYPAPADAVPRDGVPAAQPQGNARYAVPASHRQGTEPVAPARRTRVRLERDRYVIGLSLVSLATAWLPWLKSPSADMFELGTDGQLFSLSASAWDLPSRFLWTTSSALTAGGVELGWLLVLLSGLTIGASVRGAGLSAIRGFALGQMGLVMLFFFQTFRMLHDSSGVGRVVRTYGTLDVISFGPYLLFVISITLLFAPRR